MKIQSLKAFLPLKTFLQRNAQALACLTLMTGSAVAQEVNVYTYREPDLIKPLFDVFTKDTGTKVNVIFAKDGLEQRIATEGASSTADLLISVDVARLQNAVELGITQPISSELLTASVPSIFRDPQGHWFGLSSRSRVIYASKERVKETHMTYESLANPIWKGRICTRSGQHSYSNALFAHYIARYGEEKAEAWLKGLKANLARKPSAGDREVARDIAAGLCDIGLGNSYYVGLMINREPDKKPWADAIKVILPTFQSGGSHMNISGLVLAKYAPHKGDAIKLAEWLVSSKAQKIYAETNYEYPVIAGVEIDPTLKSWGNITPDTTPLPAITAQRKAAANLVDKVGFDN